MMAPSASVRPPPTWMVYRVDGSRGCVDVNLSPIPSAVRDQVPATTGPGQSRSSPDLCVKAEEAPRLRLGCLGDLLFLEE